jgi:hypothetical protein
MFSRAIRSAMMVAAVAVMLAVSVADASSTATRAHASASGESYSLSFSPNKPAFSSSLTVTLASAQQPTSATVTLPAGTRLNLKSVRTCSAPPACDPSSQVGTGTASVHYQQYTIPLAFSIFNRPGGLAVIIAVPNGTPVVISPTWSGTTLTIPYPNGTYKGIPIQTTKISLTFDQLGSGRNAYLRTPSKCPKGGWTSTATPTFTTGVGTTVKAAAKCQVAKKKTKKKKKK